MINNQLSPNNNINNNNIHNKENKKSEKLNIFDLNFFPISQQLKEKLNFLENKMLEITQLKSYMIYEDLIINKTKSENYYIHYLHNKIIDPNKKNFIMLHGFRGYSYNFIGLIPGLHEKYNLFIPDIIGMGFSSRPQIKFTSYKQCMDFFIESINQFICQLNIDKFYLCGHSLGGTFAGNYAIKYPEKIIKVLLLSPAGISDMKIKDTNNESFFKDTKCYISCVLRMGCCIKCCEPTIQDYYNNCLFKPIIKIIYRSVYWIKDDLLEVFGQLAELSMEFPTDLDKSIFYVLKTPFPMGSLPIEKEMLNNSKLNFVICFGENDWMDRIGCERLCKKCPERFKIFIISKRGHMFVLENSKELSKIICENFPI